MFSITVSGYLKRGYICYWFQSNDLIGHKFEPSMHSFNNSKKIRSTFVNWVDPARFYWWFSNFKIMWFALIEQKHIGKLFANRYIERTNSWIKYWNKCLYFDETNIQFDLRWNVCIASRRIFPQRIIHEWRRCNSFLKTKKLFITFSIKSKETQWRAWVQKFDRY